jgi:hypothetical protein
LGRDGELVVTSWQRAPVDPATEPERVDARAIEVNYLAYQRQPGHSLWVCAEHRRVPA